MEELLLDISVTSQMLYLAFILLIIGKGLKAAPFIQNWSILWILLAISLIVTFVFNGISFKTFFEAFVATALSTTIYQTYKQTGKGFASFHKI